MKGMKLIAWGFLLLMVSVVFLAMYPNLLITKPEEVVSVFYRGHMFQYTNPAVRYDLTMSILLCWAAVCAIGGMWTLREVKLRLS
ncbi:hypothetical protein A3H65_01260 [Candidatus Giovannonibacteria bacterium RIFCSPLOWO2_02_FULL_45_14]|uniref:Uncharacterized protein n=1 Tax=Candidatus Giovannonibacteria bacterium RIFCSPLOWO2_12_FULL_44_15 TaxID=1798364 RepID=A0A1F5Y0V2_9BACT|nr:MAG: hypothetical protein A3C75_00850 [Candidatus Giovannonibacteria bacterium RIFCSPHIGHO2_02_FULL_44_31]OGF76410.1 MAG: hypothetical protein A3E62_00830 [Candidatus Giovannonibacteria bacterium RIFCSPHIGHO2_12_FULL_44_29]OGF91082.1 MAG: hypothetical protein A3H65_01260 [Candidatus Giovannonibacteria bacterium RIFCSPLOWO2_02_FULL_45_14]OGF93779.1 MAG: hypothetical protein A3G54_02625 [Candidatus Giovannonibacteria bacterium RIFCSPLOWO2_12_FULL_44_15]